MQVARHTRPKDHFKVSATNFYQGPLPHNPGLKQGYTVHRDVGLGISIRSSWPVEQKALPPFCGIGLSNGIRRAYCMHPLYFSQFFFLRIIINPLNKANLLGQVYNKKASVEPHLHLFRV